MGPPALPSLGLALRRPKGQPDEIADAVVFLLSERSGVVTGSIIDWDQNVPGAYA